METPVVWGRPDSSTAPSSSSSCGSPAERAEQRRTSSPALPCRLSFPAILTLSHQRWCPAGMRCPSLSYLSEVVILPVQLQDWRSRGDRTVLVIAHRLQTVQSADQILVLRQGELQEHGRLPEGQDLCSLVQQSWRTESPETLDPSRDHLSDPE